MGCGFMWSRKKRTAPWRGDQSVGGAECGANDRFAGKQSPCPQDADRGTRQSGFLELILAGTTDRTGPIIGDVFKGSACGNTVIRVTGSRIIFPVTNNAAIFLHVFSSFVFGSVGNQAFHKPCRLQYSRAETFSAWIQKVASGAWPGLRFWR